MSNKQAAGMPKSDFIVTLRNDRSIQDPVMNCQYIHSFINNVGIIIIIAPVEINYYCLDFSFCAACWKQLKEQLTLYKEVSQGHAEFIPSQGADLERDLLILVYFMFSYHFCFHSWIKKILKKF